MGKVHHLAGALVVSLAVCGGARAESNVLFVFDVSGSMKRAVEGGESRMAAAKRAMSAALREMPSETRLGLMLYGHRRARDCSDIELVSPVGADDAGAIADRIVGLEAKGETPIAASIERGARSFAALKGQNNAIVLVTDGIEECGGDPCAAARAVKEAGVDLKVHIVGFTLDQKQRAAIECVVKETGGRYFDARNAGALTTALAEVRQQVVQAPTPPKPVVQERFNLISPKNGGGVVLAQNDVWLATADDKEDNATWMRDGQEGVFAFQDERPGKFDTFAVLVKGAGGNPKEIELFAGDEGPTGEFRSIATCQFNNAKFVRSPYQECKFEPVTARYLKAKILSSYGDSYVVATEWRLYGELQEAAASPPDRQVTAADAINLISPKNGGGIVVAPNDVWLATADDKEDGATWMRDGQEGVFAFQDEQPATFDTFAVLVKAAGGNPKEIELSVSDDGPTGDFRSIGTCTFENAKLVKSPYQECKFEPVTARYLKAKILSSYGDSYVVATEWKVLGQIGGSDQASSAPRRASVSLESAVNLISPKNGGGILVAPNDVWLATADDKEDSATWMRDGQEGVFGFRDDRTATFDTFAVLVKGAGGNPKEIELSVSDDGPTGDFRAVAICTFENVKLIKTPYQECKFEPVTARYVKAKILSSHGDSYVVATEWKVMGELKE